MAAGSTPTRLQERWTNAFMANYGAPELMLTSGQGCRVTDADGHVYLDLIAGIATSCLGHAHPAIVKAVGEQVATLAHTSNLYAHPVALDLAEELQQLVPGPCRVFLCNDGATANEAALKLARKHGRTIDPNGGALEVVATVGGFHGRTFGALAVTGQPAKQAPFEPLPGPVTFVPYGDTHAVVDAITPGRTAAVIVEPLLGEGGVIAPEPGYLAAIRAACTAAGALMIVDEVQTGIARTGPWLASVGEGVVPDIITLAKGLGGGLPIGAVIAVGDAARLFVPGDHGSTFGGNPVSGAAALAVLRTLREMDAPHHVAAMGEYFAAAIDALGDPRIAGQRGAGLLRALVLTEVTSVRVQQAARDAGFLVNAVAPDAIRIAPPLIITATEIDEFVNALPAILDAAQAAGAAA